MKAHAPGGPAKKPWYPRLPILDWAPRYERKDAVPDLVAGMTLAAYEIPISLAYASLAGLPPQAGIYGSVLGGLAYAFLGTCRQIAVGPTTSISMLIASAIGAMAAGDPARFAALAALTAVMVAVVALGAWCFRLGNAVSFISDSVLTGFKVGAGLVIAAAQLPQLFGVQSGGHDFFEKIAHLAQHLGETHPYSLAVGLVALALLLVGDRLFPGRPVALAVVILAILVMSLTSLGEKGVDIVGTIPPGLPHLGIHGVGMRDAVELIPLGLACFMLAFVEGISTARTLALKHRYAIDVDQEMIGAAAANLASGLGQGFPMAGGMSQSVVNDESGARTPAALLWASLFMALVLLFATGLFHDLPQPVLAALVLLSVTKLVQVKEFKYLYKISRLDFWVAIVALAGVALFGILQGVLLAAVYSLLLLLKRAASPRVVRLGKLPGTTLFVDILRRNDAEQVPGVKVARVEGPLLYFNVEHVKGELLGLFALPEEKPRLAILEMATTFGVDLAGIKMLMALGEALGERGTRLMLAEITGEVQELLRTAGLQEQFREIEEETTAWTLIQRFGSDISD